MSRFLTGNVFLLISMLCAAGSQLIFKALIDEVQPGGVGWNDLREFLMPGRLARGVLAASMVVGGFACWMLSLVRLDLSYAYPIACSSVLFVALFSAIFLGEPVTPRVWGGTVLILAGVILLAPAR